MNRKEFQEIVSGIVDRRFPLLEEGKKYAIDPLVYDANLHEIEDAVMSYKADVDDKTREELVTWALRRYSELVDKVTGRRVNVTEFVIKEYKKNEFVSLLSLYAHDGQFNFGQVESDPNGQPEGMTKMTIQANVAEKLTEEQLVSLRDV